MEVEPLLFVVWMYIMHPVIAVGGELRLASSLNLSNKLFINQHRHWVADILGPLPPCMCLDISDRRQVQSPGCWVISWELQTRHLSHLPRHLLPAPTGVAEENSKLVPGVLVLLVVLSVEDALLQGDRVLARAWQRLKATKTLEFQILTRHNNLTLWQDRAALELLLRF